MKDLFYLDAVNEALTEEMARDDKVFIIGEDIAVGYGGGGFLVPPAACWTNSAKSGSLMRRFRNLPLPDVQLVLP